jgi:hypothetical protein
VNDSVRRYAGKTGVVTEIRNGGVGVNLKNTTSHASATWFRPSELTPVEIGQRAEKAPRGPAKAVGG